MSQTPEVGLLEVVLPPFDGEAVEPEEDLAASVTKLSCFVIKAPRHSAERHLA
jgi:hypothetical protein